MLLDFSVDWRWVIGGTDVSPFVETWELAREQPDMGTPAWWRGRLVLRPVVGRDLNLDPLTNSLWRQGTSCSLTVAGSLVFTGSILLAYYDDWSTAPRLELEVGDVLAAKNHRQVIPFGEYDAWSLLAALGIPGVAPAGDKVELSTDLTSPVKVLQELTWVTSLKERGLPATLFTRPNGRVDYVRPQTEFSMTRTLEQVADFTRQRPALEIPGAVVASASLTYLVQPPPPVDKETALVSVEGGVVKVTYLDSLGRVVKEEVYRDRVLEGYTEYSYSVSYNRYEIIKQVFVRVEDPYRPRYRFFERTLEEGKRLYTPTQWIIREDSNVVVYGGIVAQKKTYVYWPGWRLFPLPEGITEYYRAFLVYLVEEYSILGRLIPKGAQQIYHLVADTTHLLRMVTRARGTTQETDTFWEAITLSPASSELILNQEIQFPGWVKQFWDPPKPEKVTDVLSEEMAVVGFSGPPVYVSVPWLSVTVDEQPGSSGLERRIEALRQRIKFTLQAAATWMATEIAGRAFARRIKMPVPPEWLGNPRPWTLARVGNEVFWLVGETLRGTSQGVEFEATGILAGRPNTIPPDAFPPGMFPPGTIPPDTPSPGLFPPGTIPSFIPLVTVRPPRFPSVGIGCAMSAGEAVVIPGDPWLGMAVEIEYEVSAPVGTFAMVGIGVGELTEAWLGLAADATYEVEGDEDDEDNEDDSGDEVEGLTLEAEDGVIYNGSIIHDSEASSCYAVGDEFPSIDVIVNSTSLSWARPLRLRVVYKATEEGEIYIYVLRQGSGFFLATFEVFPTNRYSAVDLAIPVSEEPFEGIGVDATNGIRLDAIQLAPATGDWPPLNPCSD